MFFTKKPFHTGSFFFLEKRAGDEERDGEQEKRPENGDCPGSSRVCVVLPMGHSSISREQRSLLDSHQQGSKQETSGNVA